jgi:mono/diheme cytochrome c family protein
MCLYEYYETRVPCFDELRAALSNSKGQVYDNLQMGSWFVRLLLATASAAAFGAQSTPAEKGREVFRACSGCHNVLTDARKSGPSLRTLFGKVRLINGKRAIDQNVMELVTEGYNGMPSYKNMLRPQDWEELMAYLKTLRGRPEITPVLRPIRGSDEEILSRGKKIYAEECESCHAPGEEKIPDLLTLYKRPAFENGERVAETGIVQRIREGHGEMAPKAETFDDASLFTLIAYLKAQ